MARRVSLKKDEEFSKKEILIYSLAGLTLATGGFLLVRGAIRKSTENRQHNLSFEEGNVATMAKRIRMAFDNDGWPGTDMQALRKVIREIPSREDFVRTGKSYQQLYRENLLKEMENRLQTSEYQEMISIIASKPERTGGQVSLNYLSLAKRLKAAFDKSYGFFPGTDEDAIKAVFVEIPSKVAFQEVSKAYQMEFGNSLLSDLKSELEWWEYGDYIRLIEEKP